MEKWMVQDSSGQTQEGQNLDTVHIQHINLFLASRKLFLYTEHLTRLQK